MTPNSATDAITAANRALADAKAEAEMHKQAAIAEAMKLPMPDHLAAIRAAERAYYTALAEAADATGIINPTSYRQAAASIR